MQSLGDVVDLANEALGQADGNLGHMSDDTSPSDNVVDAVSYTAVSGAQTRGAFERRGRGPVVPGDARRDDQTGKGGNCEKEAGSVVRMRRSSSPDTQSAYQYGVAST